MRKRLRNQRQTCLTAEPSEAESLLAAYARVFWDEALRDVEREVEAEGQRSPSHRRQPPALAE
jgi:hypothetical protein